MATTNSALSVPFFVKWKILLLIPLVLAYFISPLDLVNFSFKETFIHPLFPNLFLKKIPDFIPFVGYLDDLCLVGLLITSLSTFIDYFRHWEQVQIRIKELENEVEKWKQECENRNDEQKCCICLETSIEVLLEKCHHACVCQKCVAYLKECPLCRSRIESSKRVYFN